MHLAFTFYLISIREYANAQCLSNLINLFLRQSQNVNPSWATSARSLRIRAGEAAEPRLQAEPRSVLTLSSGTLIQTKTLTFPTRLTANSKSEKKKKCQGITIEISPFCHQKQTRGDSWVGQNLHSKTVPKLPKSSYFVIYWG